MEEQNDSRDPGKRDYYHAFSIGSSGGSPAVAAMLPAVA
jgi:hypothetical protein